MLAENFAEQGGERRKAVALQGRQRSIAENRPQRLSIFYLSLVLGVSKKAPDTNAPGVFVIIDLSPLDYAAANSSAAFP